jgi:hypothetical protein
VDKGRRADAQDAGAGENKNHGDCAQTEAERGSNVSESASTWGDAGGRTREKGLKARSMRLSDWSTEEVRRLAESSGKPLEVACAQAFLAAGWNARLGSHFASGALDETRELDVLAVKEQRLLAQSGVTVRLRVLVSCRGFPNERAALTYSVSSSCVPSFGPSLLSSHRAREAGQRRESYGVLPDLEGHSAAQLLHATELDTARALIAFNIIERTPPKVGKGAKAPERTATYKAVGDGELFKAIDSALSAAFYWRQQDNSDASNFVALNVPVLLLSIPYFDVCVDQASVGEPAVRSRGYQSNSYPDRPNPTQAMVLVWTRGELPTLVQALDSLFAWFLEELRKPEYICRWPIATA